MVFLLFRIGADRYAIETGCVVEVLPRLELKTIPQAAPGIAGVFDYHGVAVPVVDITAMALQQPAKKSLSTRLVVLRYADATVGESPRLLGLLAEMATETVRLNKEDFQDSGVFAENAPYLGPVVNDSRGIIQMVEIGRLISPEVRAELWRKAEAVA